MFPVRSHARGRVPGHVPGTNNHMFEACQLKMIIRVDSLCFNPGISAMADFSVRPIKDNENLFTTHSISCNVPCDEIHDSQTAYAETADATRTRCAYSATRISESVQRESHRIERERDTGSLAGDLQRETRTENTPLKNTTQSQQRESMLQKCIVFLFVHALRPLPSRATHTPSTPLVYPSRRLPWPVPRTSLSTSAPEFRNKQNKGKSVLSKQSQP